MSDTQGVSTGIQTFPARAAEVGALTVHRALPVRERRLVGPWCFFDHFGPIRFESGKPMDVAPHPHIGLQTVSWLFDGEVLHNDSAGGEALLKAGELNLMTAGAGIAHSEETPSTASGKLHGVQLWVALPEANRHMAPSFRHYTDIPVAELPGGRLAVIMGELAKTGSPAATLSPLVGAEARLERSGTMEFALEPAFEHALVLIEGDLAVNGTALEPQGLNYLDPGRTGVSLSSRAGARAMLVGGKPFGESIVMWWNFVGRSYEEMEEARRDWEEHRRFGDVRAYQGPRLPAPPLQVRLK